MTSKNQSAKRGTGEKPTKVIDLVAYLKLMNEALMAESQYLAKKSHVLETILQERADGLAEYFDEYLIILACLEDKDTITTIRNTCDDTLRRLPNLAPAKSNK